jgi:hypothetical protein
MYTHTSVFFTPLGETEEAQLAANHYDRCRIRSGYPQFHRKHTLLGKIKLRYFFHFPMKKGTEMTIVLVPHSVIFLA